MKNIKLNNGLEIPQIGFGTYKSEAQVILQAIEAGYRYFDTASFYGTEKSIAEAVKKSGLRREEFFIASKLWKDDMGYEKTKTAFNKTLENLESEYIDVFMIHWPRPDLRKIYRRSCKEKRSQTRRILRTGKNPRSRFQ